MRDPTPSRSEPTSPSSTSCFPMSPRVSPKQIVRPDRLLGAPLDVFELSSAGGAPNPCAQQQPPSYNDDAVRNDKPGIGLNLRQGACSSSRTKPLFPSSRNRIRQRQSSFCGGPASESAVTSIRSSVTWPYGRRCARENCLRGPICVGAFSSFLSFFPWRRRELLRTVGKSATHWGFIDDLPPEEAPGTRVDRGSDWVKDGFRSYTVGLG